ncbi:MAG: hypothetical protein R6U50_18465 [Desulfobacterales bacterium]
MEDEMKNLFIGIIAVSMCLGFAGTAAAASSATQTVNYQVSEINELSVSGHPADMVISTATAGSEPDEVIEDTTTYAISTNCTNKKITADIDSEMPAGVTLKINLAEPTGAVSSGDVDISSATVNSIDVVTGISKVAESGLSIIYKLSAVVAAGHVPLSDRVITLTIIDAL